MGRGWLNANLLSEPLVTCSGAIYGDQMTAETGLGAALEDVLAGTGWLGGGPCCAAEERSRSRSARLRAKSALSEVLYSGPSLRICLDRRAPQGTRSEAEGKHSGRRTATPCRATRRRGQYGKPLQYRDLQERTTP